MHEHLSSVYNIYQTYVLVEHCNSSKGSKFTTIRILTSYLRVAHTRKINTTR